MKQKVYSSINERIDGILAINQKSIADLTGKLAAAKKDIEAAAADMAAAMAEGDAEKYSLAKSRKQLFSDAVEMYTVKLEQLTGSATPCFATIDETMKVLESIVKEQDRAAESFDKRLAEIIRELEQLLNDTYLTIREGDITGNKWCNCVRAPDAGNRTIHYALPGNVLRTFEFVRNESIRRKLDLPAYKDPRA